MENILEFFAGDESFAFKMATFLIKKHGLTPTGIGFCVTDANEVIELIGGDIVAIPGPLYYRNVLSEEKVYEERFHAVVKSPHGLIIDLGNPIQVYENGNAYLNLSGITILNPVHFKMAQEELCN